MKRELCDICNDPECLLPNTSEPKSIDVQDTEDRVAQIRTSLRYAYNSQPTSELERMLGTIEPLFAIKRAIDAERRAKAHVAFLLGD